MMERMRISLGVAAAAGLFLLAVSTAQAQTLTIEVTSIPTQAKVHDRAPQGRLNAGDSIAFKDLLLNRKRQFGKRTGKPVAYDVGTLIYTSKTERRISATATFPRIGTITYAGPVVERKDGSTVIPITGGTGGFRGASGTVTIGKGETKAPNTYVITVPHHLDLNATGVA
jgi:hypothetical protein